MTARDDVRRSESSSSEEEDRNAVFGVIFEGTAEGVAEHKVRKSNQLNNDVIQPPSSSRAKREFSRAYTRPAFKQPGSKIAELENHVDLESRLRQVDNVAYDQAAERSISLVNELLGEVRSLEYKCGDEDVIHPSRNANELLLRISSRSTDLDDTDKSVGLEKSLLRKYESPTRSQPRPHSQQRRGYEYHANRYESGSSRRIKRSFASYRRPERMRDRDDQTDCGESVATVSDLDNLAAKALRRKQPTMDVSSLKNDIKKMVRRFDEQNDKQTTARRREAPTSIPADPKLKDALTTSLSHSLAASNKSDSRIPSEHSRSSRSQDDGERDTDGKVNYTVATNTGVMQTIASAGLKQMWSEVPTLQNLADDLIGFCTVPL